MPLPHNLYDYCSIRISSLVENYLVVKRKISFVDKVDILFTKTYYTREVNLYCRLNFIFEGADKILDYYRASKGAFLCIQKNKRILHYGYIIKQSL